MSEKILMSEFSLDLHQSLKIKSEEWDFSVDGDPQELNDKMVNFMLANKGIGLAANQINLTKRIFVMGHTAYEEFPKPFAVINPTILETSKELVLDTEGCLSYPGIFLTIKRPKWIIASYRDVKGDLKDIKLEGYASKCFQHETDHLDGICFVDKVSQMKLQLAIKKARKQSQ
jgi:peptide deformylase